MGTGHWAPGRQRQPRAKRKTALTGVGVVANVERSPVAFARPTLPRGDRGSGSAATLLATPVTPRDRRCARCARSRGRRARTASDGARGDRVARGRYCRKDGSADCREHAAGARVLSVSCRRRIYAPMTGKPCTKWPPRFQTGSQSVRAQSIPCEVAHKHPGRRAIEAASQSAPQQSSSAGCWFVNGPHELQRACGGNDRFDRPKARTLTAEPGEGVCACASPFTRAELPGTLYRILHYGLSCFRRFSSHIACAREHNKTDRAWRSYDWETSRSLYN